MLNYNMQSLAFSPIPEQNPIEAYGNMLHSDGFISVSGINRRKICRSRMVRRFLYRELPYRTRSERPMRSTVVDLMPFRRQMFVTVVP